MLYKYNNNRILIHHMKAISGSKFIWVFKDLHKHLFTIGINPEYKRMDNEASPTFQKELKSKDIDFQLSPPGIHRPNAHERAISTFKDYFIAGIRST